MIRPSGASVTLTPEPDVPTILDAVQRRGDWGIIAWENNVEGYVVPNLDALIDADNVVGFARVGVNVSFDAFTLPGASLADCRTVTAHPHGLAQCRRFTADHQLQQLPASSNGAACRDLEPGQVALGPSICGDLYNLTRVACAVGDYAARAPSSWHSPRGTRPSPCCASGHHGRPGMRPWDRCRLRGRRPTPFRNTNRSSRSYR